MLRREEGNLWRMGIVQSQYQAQSRASKCPIKIIVSVSLVNQPGECKLTGRITCTTILEPAETEVSLAGNPILIPCAKHVVVKAASNAATVNFMVVVAIEFGDSELVGSLKDFQVRIGEG
jgi:hypothetical protein